MKKTKELQAVNFTISIETHKKILKVKSITLEDGRSQMERYVSEGVDKELKKHKD